MTCLGRTRQLPLLRVGAHCGARSKELVSILNVNDATLCDDNTEAHVLMKTQPYLMATRLRALIRRYNLDH
jgi:hypothetical protein